jgi:hypothetical protein
MGVVLDIVNKRHMTTDIICSYKTTENEYTKRFFFKKNVIVQFGISLNMNTYPYSLLL